MKKLIWVLMIPLLLLVRPGANVVEAQISPGIKIDGQSRTFDPPCQIVKGRTMVPLRFVIEDPALQGQVSWDGNLRKVSITCRGKTMEFLIDNPRVLVDGQPHYLDSSPYIYQGRSYLPLRFLAEQLGAFVTWNSQKWEVNINFTQPAPEVFAYYYGRSLGELKENAHLFTDIALRWLVTNEKGDLSFEYQDNFGEVLQVAREKGLKTHISVAYMDKAGLHTLLSNYQNRQNLIGNLLREVKVNNYDGVNIDFEFLAPEDADNYCLFLQELKERLGEKQLSVAVFARTAKDRWPTGYDYPQIGQLVDRVVVMSYDYSYKTSPPGPIAPLWWVENVVDYMTQFAGIPESKLLLGMPTYGYDWAPGQNTTTVTAPKLEALRSNYQLQEHFDSQSMSPYYTYYDNNNILHTIWLENEKSLQEKWQVAIDNNLAGISFWRVGNGFRDLYDLLDKKQ